MAGLPLCSAMRRVAGSPPFLGRHSAQACAGWHLHWQFGPMGQQMAFIVHLFIFCPFCDSKSNIPTGFPQKTSKTRRTSAFFKNAILAFRHSQPV